jgi:hypothetical protein
MLRSLLRSPVVIHFVWLPLYQGRFGMEPMQRSAVISRWGGKHAIDECHRLAGIRSQRENIRAHRWLLFSLACAAGLFGLFLGLNR